MDGWMNEWDNPQDAVYDKVRSGVVAAKEEFEAPIRAAERERIIKKLLYVMSQPNFRWDLWLTTEDDLRRFLNEEETK